MKLRGLKILCLCFIFSAVAYGQEFSLNSSLEWDKMEMNVVVSLDLASTKVKLPAGRNVGEAMIDAEYLRLVMPGLLSFQADSSSTLSDLVSRGELSMTEVEGVALNARRTPSYLSPDLLRLSVSYSINMAELSGILIGHTRPTEIRRVLGISSTLAYTGIIIIASSPLPVHGMKSETLALPCLLPKIWDTSMNLVFDQTMLEIGKKAVARYSAERSIFFDSPSGLSPQITALVGSKPLKIFARGLFGAKPTDMIIDAKDALQIISSPENRRLLSEGKIVIILDDSAL